MHGGGSPSFGPTELAVGLARKETRYAGIGPAIRPGDASLGRSGSPAPSARRRQDSALCKCVAPRGAAKIAFSRDDRTMGPLLDHIRSYYEALNTGDANRVAEHFT